MCDEFDILELAYRVTGKSEQEAEEAINDDDSDIDRVIFDRYQCDFVTFCAIVKDLIKFTPTHTGALSGVAVHGFVDVEQSRIIVKANAQIVEKQH